MVTTTATIISVIEPDNAEAMHIETAATGGTHRTGTSHQSILEGYQRGSIWGMIFVKILGFDRV